MFEFIRKHLKVVMIVFFPLVFFAFVLVGIDASMLGNRSPVVARVAGKDITQSDWDFAHRQYADRMRVENPGLPAEMLDSPMQRYLVLENLVRDEVFATAAADRHYTISDAQLARELQNQPEIMQLRGSDGRLDTNAYRDLLRRHGMTPEMYEASVRQQLALQQVLGVVQNSATLTPRQAQPAVDAVFQRRVVGIKRFSPGDFSAQVPVDDAALKAYYDSHSAQFQRPELLDVEYVVLDLESLMAGIDVAEEELRSYYENNKPAYAQSQEQRRARHILFATDSSMSSEQREQARAKADAALAQLRQDPSRFEAIAKEQSDDPGSKDKGGDLGFFARGAMVADFDAAVFGLDKDAISDVIATEYGFHIIQLTDVKPAIIPSFEEVRERLEKDVKNNLARNRYIERTDQLRNLAHEQPDSLQPIVDELGLRIETAQNIAQSPDEKNPAALQAPTVLNALFAQQAKQARENIEVIDIGNNKMVTARVTKVHEAQVQPFEQVRDQVQRLYVERESAKLARQAGEAALARWQADANSIDTAQDVTVSRQHLQGLSPADVEQILAVPQAELPSLKGFEQADGGYLLARIKEIAPLLDESQPADARDTMLEGMRLQVAQSLSNAEVEAYYEVLKQAYDVQIRVPRPN
ncbi:SurA N-terminal domain-containing protein [Vandammella animalimorsus]|uniref:Periplasmic chaperone PpiD n=1 Tax=Vandammella animalimorsus TaxID=2029117 RepID=A0A2A2A7X9_9BURK|nr:SurA N-terminal domain-containing protein [Vandammella animalimorsus]PAT33848.1 peptidylprolyl isomerase [Vandammella animalimorsus]